MESKDQTPSVILKLMGLDKVPPQHKDPVRDRQKVLSEDYLQKVASIGVRKKRSSHQHHSFGKEEYDDVLKVVKTIRRHKNHNPSKGNVEGVPQVQQLLNGSVKCKPETSVDTTSSFTLKTCVKAEQGYPPLQQKANNGLQNVVHGEAGLYEAFRLSRSQFDLKDEAFNSRIAVSNGTRNLSRQSGFSNDKIKRNIRCKVGMNYRFARKVPRARPLCEASVVGDNCTTLTKDDLFLKYWGLRMNVSANWSIHKSKKQNINQKDYSEEMNLRSSSEKSPSFSSYFNGNDTEENCIDLHKLKKRCYGMDLSDKKPMLSQLSSSGPSPAFINSQILQQTCLMNDDVKNNKHEGSNMSKQSAVSLDSSVDCLVSDAKTEVVGWSHNNPTKQQSESTDSVMTHGDSDSLSHTSYALTQQDPSEFQEDSAYSLCSGADPDSLGSFQQEAYEPSPISVLDPTFREDISFISECGAGVYDSSEVDDEGLDLNVSSDEDVGKESIGDFEEKKDIVGISRTEESRDFSYVVEVLTEAGTSNRSLFKDFTTWHSAECPISPSVFEVMEKKFGEQQHWKRSERRLLFDRINLGLLEILRPYLYVPNWEKPVSRRVNVEPSQDMIEEEIWGLLVSQEKKASKESSDDMLGGEIRWIELGEEVEDIVREIVKLLIEELANEIVSLENF